MEPVRVHGRDDVVGAVGNGGGDELGISRSAFPLIRLMSRVLLLSASNKGQGAYGSQASRLAHPGRTSFDLRNSPTPIQARVTTTDRTGLGCVSIQ